MEPLVTVPMLAMEVSMVATEVTMASVRLTLMPTPLAKLPTAFLWPMLTLLAILTTLESSLEWVTPDTGVMLDTEVTIMDSMASVRLTLMPTPLGKLPTAFLWPMPTLLAILIMLESSLEWVTPDTEVMLDTEVTIILDSMASVRLTLMPTPLARLPTASLWPMPTLLAILTTLELSPELVIPDTAVMLDMEVTLDTSTDKCLQGHCPATYLLNDFTCFLMNKNYKPAKK